jgi:uncharacterized protein YaeQ
VALRSTVYRADLAVSGLDRGVYAQHALTLARHPSETEERLMVRLLAFALHADERLAFGRGLSAEDEADLWQRDDTGAIVRWIDVGLPDEKDIRKACGRAAEVVVFAYGARRVDAWWSANEAALSRLGNLRVYTLAASDTDALAALAARSMTLTCTVQDEHVWLADANSVVEIRPQRRR